jgi:hypothetical protein
MGANLPLRLILGRRHGLVNTQQRREVHAALEIPGAWLASLAKQSACVTLISAANCLIPTKVGRWMLMSLHQWLVKTGRRLLKQACDN